MSEEDDILAAELAFGLLDPAERGGAEARLGRDPVFAAAHRRWLEQATALLDGPDEAPSAGLFPAIEARLPANDDGRVPAARLRVWQALTAVAAAAAVLFAVLLARPTPPPVVLHDQPAPPLVAVLTAATGKVVVTVSLAPNAGAATVAPDRLNAGSGDAELWVIPEDGKPRALGVIDARRREALALPPAAAPVLVAGSTLAVSLEPKGGSPTGQPTGPVILTGKIAQS